MLLPSCDKLNESLEVLIEVFNLLVTLSSFFLCMSLPHPVHPWSNTGNKKSLFGTWELVAFNLGVVLSTVTVREGDGERQSCT